ncbi:MAG: SdrD B-like domain-containing protein, partial [Ferruginibacter sp.]
MKQTSVQLIGLMKKLCVLVLVNTVLINFSNAQNPLAPALNFNVFTEGNITMKGGDVEGAIGAGGNFVVDGVSQYLQSNSSLIGNPYVNISGTNYAMVINGNFTATAGNFNVNGNLNNWIKIGNLNGATNGTANGNQLKPTIGNVYILVNNTNQTYSQIQGTGLVNFATAFTTLKATSTSLANLANTIAPNFVNGSSNPTITLAAGRNVWNISGATLNAYTTITFSNKPTSSNPLIINVNAAGNYALNMPNMSGVGPTDAPYIIFNFYNATTLNYGGMATITGSVLAPLADVIKTASQNIDGQIIAKSFLQSAGEVHHAPFNTTVSVTPTCTETTRFTESFPNQFNTGFTAPINSSFTGSLGSWAANSNNNKATIVVNSARFVSASNAIKIVNYNTSGLAAATGTATSPALNLSTLTSEGTVDVKFKLSTYTLTNTNTCFTFNLDFSNNNGSSWTTVWTRTAQQLVNTYGADTWNDITVAVPSSFLTSNFKLRLVGAQSANCGFDSYMYIDDIRIVSNNCTPANLTLGNLVWADFNDNGIVDAGEPGYQGATVRLYLDNDNNGVADAGWVTQTRTTDANGNYSFANLATGKYFVQLENVPSWFYKSTPYGGAPDNNIDNDNNGFIQTGTIIKGETINLTSGGEPTGGITNNTYDFGFYKGNGLGDFVWLDDNTNGIQDAGEPGIANVTVRLRNSSTNAILATTTTDNNGAYFFYDPEQYGTNTYNIEFVTPVGYVATAANQGVNDAKDSDPINTRINGVNVPSGVWNHTFDAGFVKVGSIGDKVWNDTDRDGVQDAGEVGIAGITVSLYNASNALVATTVTDALGNYLFANLPVSIAGNNYQVRFSLQPEYAFSPALQGGNTATDSDPNSSTGRTANIVLTSATPSRTDVDAGMYYALPNRIGDFIWNDLNKNGVQDAGEPGIAGVTITLYNNLGIAIRTTITDNNGYYQFTDLAQGTSFTLGLTLPVGYIASTKDQGGDDTKDSDFDAATLRTTSFTVSVGTVNLTFDGGLQVTPTTRASVGDKVWYDLNNNHLQDAGEPGVAGVTVELFTSANVVSATLVTDAFGNYMFNNVVPATYYVKFSNIPSGYVFSNQNVGGNPNVAIDSDPNSTSGITPSFVLVADQTLVTVDAGIRNTAVSNNSILGDYVWYDVNKNGLQGTDEAGVPGVTVILYNTTTGATVATTTTDGNGLYLFTGLAVGNYTVGFTNLPSGYTFTASNAGADASDSDVDPNTGRTGSYTISTDGTTNRTIDAGIIPNPNVRDGKGSIGDVVWNDINGNNLQDAGEPGIPNVTVTLYAANGTTVIATTTTDGLGGYLFTNLDAGTYVVGFSNLPSGYVFVTANSGSNDAIDSDTNATTGLTGTILLAAGEVNTTIDAGAKLTTALSSLGDRVWYDVNSNGIQDAGENGVAGVTVTLYNTNFATLAVTATNTSGNYLFTGLAAGSYIVGFSNLPAGYVFATANASGSTTANNSDANSTTGFTGTITLAANTSDLNWDAGITTTTRAAVGDYVWADANNNGIQDAGELPVGGITVTLFNTSNVAIASAITNGSGYYFFNNLTAGTYTIRFTNLPVNTGFTVKNASGSTAANNSDVNTATGITDAFTLTAGQVRTDIDAGLIALFAAVGDYVWYDRDANGRQDAGEIPVAGVTVTLYDASNNKVASAVTTGNGRYFINNIPVAAAGTSFTIVFSDLPANTQAFTIKNAPTATTATN